MTRKAELRNKCCALAILLCFCLGCATGSKVRLEQGQVPDTLKDLERYVLDDSHRFQDLLETRGALYEDPALQGYLDHLFQPLIPALPSPSPYHFTLKIVRDPTLNAFTLGDGTIYLNTGLIARLKSSRQFAFIVGHELAHVLNRDLLYFTDSLHRKTVAAKLTGLVVTPALSAIGLGGLGDVGVGLAYAASVTGYGREHEDQADRESLNMMRRLGYDEHEAIHVFEILLAEHQRYQRGIEIGLLSSHPSNEHRLQTVKVFVGPKALDGSVPETLDETFLNATQRLRIENATFNIQLSRYDHAVEDLRLLLSRTPHDAAAHCALGEAYRLIAQDPKKLKDELNAKTWKEITKTTTGIQHADWRARALEEYQRSLSVDPHSPNPYRGLGLLCEAQGQFPEALIYFQRYLELNPTAKDRRFVSSAITRIQHTQAQKQED